MSTWKDRCPVEKLKKHIVRKDTNYEEKFHLIEKYIEIEIDEAFEFAKNSKSPQIDQLGKHIYA